MDFDDHHQDQIAYWNDLGGKKWLAAQVQTDLMLAPASELLMERAAIELGMCVLDIGCGCGATTIDLAKTVGAEGKVIGIDVSAPMAAFAQDRLREYPQARLVAADASTYPFSPFADIAVSRFGVMFFGEPISSFANIRRGLKPHGRLVFLCWRKFEENVWMKVPLHAAYDAGVPRMPRPGPEDPGPFSFADPSRVASILTQAGFAPPRFSKADIDFDIATGGGLQAAVRQSLLIGATSRALKDQPEELKVAAGRAIEAALQPYAQGQSVRMAAAIWVVESQVA